jgi:NAD-dependent SIR2 family protein deacetylase
MILLVAAEWIRSADAILFGAGAGMGVDSGLPDFRGRTGFWKAYPPLERLGLDFYQIASPAAFRERPRLAWGFYGHRLQLYRDTRPHAGFTALIEMANAKPQGLFVFTSNVDGQFQYAGVPEDQICEVHGSIHHLQCTRPCSDRIWEAAELEPCIDMDRLEWTGPLPECPLCGALARPNILMFGDGSWVEDRTAAQSHDLQGWLRETPNRVVIEAGAGAAVPTVQKFCAAQRRPLVRINPELEDGVRGEVVTLQLGAREALERLLALTL